MTSEATSEASETSSINSDLIRRYFEAGDLQNLTTVFNFMHRQMTRAEELSRAYLAQMIVLEKRLGNSRRQDLPLPAREPSTKDFARDLKRAARAETIAAPKPKAQPKVIDLDDLDI